MRLLTPFLCALIASATLAASPDLSSSIRTVEEIRGHSFARPVESAAATRADLRTMIKGEIAREAGSAEAYRRTLEAMLVVDRDDRVIDQLLDAYESQVLAWYSPEERKFFVLSDPVAELPDLPLMRQMIEVHELMHALQDQRFDAGSRLREWGADWDRAQAYHAVLEGEASLVMMDAMMRGMGLSLEAAAKEGLDPAAISAAMEQGAAAGGAGDFPPYFMESMKFPYLEGLKFVFDAWQRDGWAGVDRIHQNPPISTEEILSPELYRARVAQKRPFKAGSFSSTAGAFSTSLGEFHWRFLLGKEPAAGVDRGSFRMVPQSAGRWAVEIDTSWDTEKDAGEFATAYRAFLQEREIAPKITRQGRNVRATYEWRERNQ